jgi:hypothetical protein
MGRLQPPAGDGADHLLADRQAGASLIRGLKAIPGRVSRHKSDGKIVYQILGAEKLSQRLGAEWANCGHSEYLM